MYSEDELEDEYELEDPIPRNPSNPHLDSPAPFKVAATTSSSSSDSRSAAPRQDLSGAAVVSLILALISPVMIYLSLLPLITPVAAIITGHKALWSIACSRGEETGQGVAIAGLAIGYPMCLLSILIFFGGLASLFQGGSSDVSGDLSMETNEWMSVGESNLDSTDQVAHGNNPQAILLAENFTEQVRSRYETAMDRIKRSDLFATDFRLVTHCQLHGSSCVFLVYVPSYSSLPRRAQEGLVQDTWRVAHKLAHDFLQPDEDLVVAIRGDDYYGAVMVGRAAQMNCAPNNLIDSRQLAKFFKSDQTDPFVALRTKVQDQEPKISPLQLPIQPVDTIVESAVVCDIKDFRPPVRSIAFSLAGDRLAVGTLDSRLLLYDVKTGKEIGSLGQIPGLGSVDSVLITPDGKKVVAADVRGTIQLADVAQDGRLTPGTSFQAHEGTIHCLGASDDSRFLISGGADQFVIYSSLDDGMVLNRFSAEKIEHPVIAVQLTMDDKHAVATDGLTLIQIDLEKSTVEPRSLVPEAVSVGCFSPDGQQFAGLETNRVRLWNTANGKQLQRPFFHQSSSTHCLTMTRDGRHLMIGANGLVAVWDIDQPASLGRIGVGNQSHPVNAITISPNGKLMAAICNNAALVQVLDIRNLGDRPAESEAPSSE